MKRLFMPGSLLVWSLPFTFVLHLADETLVSGGFVSGVQRHIWPQYDIYRFGLVNLAFFTLIVLSSYLASTRSGKWAFLPLFWLWERSWNGVWHVAWTAAWKEYSPGLGTSILFGLLLIGVLIQEEQNKRPSGKTIILAAITALVFEIGLISTLFIFR